MGIVTAAEEVAVGAVTGGVNRATSALFKAVGLTMVAPQLFMLYYAVETKNTGLLYHTGLMLVLLVCLLVMMEYFVHALGFTTPSAQRQELGLDAKPAEAKKEE